ncbi:hypothetical protein L207DRAFT_509782 [Hyaloscypha variabilis F]|uniref:Uncharacterized protein n=1 Tax=Hyaloscypha variabilis (strain UAMH 11265 / GT02V1 / F) TaxID=1149755 RepID=A0A2J6RXN1_HYAVF|nr:hypothetical protein L207DRAFT_509782 [Hyaloscypha variabilis F]
MCEWEQNTTRPLAYRRAYQQHGNLQLKGQQRSRSILGAGKISCVCNATWCTPTSQGPPFPVSAQAVTG